MEKLKSFLSLKVSAWAAIALVILSYFRDLGVYTLFGDLYNSFNMAGTVLISIAWLFLLLGFIRVAYIAKIPTLKMASYAQLVILLLSYILIYVPKEAMPMLDLGVTITTIVQLFMIILGISLLHANKYIPGIAFSVGLFFILTNITSIFITISYQQAGIMADAFIYWIASAFGVTAQVLTAIFFFEENSKIRDKK